jgi:hypothetical protein
MICNGAYWKIVYQYVCFPPSQRHSSQEDGARHLVTCKRDGYDTSHMTLCEASGAIFCVHSISFRPSKCFPLPHYPSANISLPIFHLLKRVCYTLTIRVSISTPFRHCHTAPLPLSHYLSVTIPLLVSHYLTTPLPLSQYPLATISLSIRRYLITRLPLSHKLWPLSHYSFATISLPVSHYLITR